MEDVETTVLVSDASLADALRESAERRAIWPHLRIERFCGSTSSAVSQARLQRGGAPLGVLADTEADALEAIAYGADEAEVLGEPRDARVVRFVERLQLRASLRRDAERMQRSSAHAEKLSALGTLIAGIGHEINNPLSVLTLSVDAVRRAVEPLLESGTELRALAQSSSSIAPEALCAIAARIRAGAGTLDARSLLDEMGSASQAIADVVRDMRLFARADDGEHPALVDLPEVIDQVMRLAGREIERRALVEHDYASNVPQLVLPRGRLTQVIMNLVLNAGQAMREVERPVHRLRFTTRMDEDFVALCISDTGPGIPPSSVERIFDPFYTTKRAELGTGLGLSISRSLLRGFGGDLLVDSVHGDGATFICLLPRPTTETIRSVFNASDLGGVPLMPPPDLSVLVVDDDDRMLRAYARFLHPRCRIVVARDGNEAVELLDSGSKVDVVVTDLQMLEVDHFSLISWLRERRPELARRTILVVDALDDTHDDYPDLRDMPTLAKPIEGNALLALLDRVVS
jgi:signal transduction histidine kinase